MDRPSVPPNPEHGAGSRLRSKLCSLAAATQLPQRFPPPPNYPSKTKVHIIYRTCCMQEKMILLIVRLCKILHRIRFYAPHFNLLFSNRRVGEKEKFPKSFLEQFTIFLIATLFEIHVVKYFFKSTTGNFYTCHKTLNACSMNFPKSIILSLKFL